MFGIAEWFLANTMTRTRNDAPPSPPPSEPDLHQDDDQGVTWAEMVDFLQQDFYTELATSTFFISITVT